MKMLGLNHRATWVPQVGQKSGKPAYADNGTEFSCRIQPTDIHTLATLGITSADSITVYCLPAGIHTGDKIITPAQREYIVRSVREEYGFRGLHHLKIIALGDTPR